MAITLADNARNGSANAVVDLIDTGSGAANGQIRIFNSGRSTLLSTLNFSAVAFGDAATGVATANAIAADTNAAATGTAAEFVIVNKAGTEILRGTITDTAGSGDMKLSRTNITAGDTVSITSMTFTVPAT